jgi:hypothetical protein
MVLIKLAFYSACLSLFTDQCFNEGMIMEWYYKLLLKIDYLAISKPLGLCIYCMSSWVFIALYLVQVVDIRQVIPTIIGLFCGLGLNFFFIKTYQKYIE